MQYYTNVAILGNHILYRGIKDNKRIQQKISYKPSLFLKTQKKTTSPFKNMDGEVVDSMNFASIREAKDFQERYQNTDGMTIYGMNRFEYAYISDQHFQQDVPWNIEDIKIGIIDIEVASENGFPEPDVAIEEVTAITYKEGEYFHVWGCGDFVTKEKNVFYTKCVNEEELLKRFLSHWEKNYPDILTGWNTNGFDIPYLHNRIKKLFGEKEVLRLSPWKKIGTRSFTISGRENIAYDLVGISSLDYLQVYKKFAKDGTSKDSYKLNNIAHIEIKEKKIDYSEYDTLHLLYKLNFQKFIEYNIHDVRLVDKLEGKLNLIRQCIFVAYNARVNYSDVFMQVRMWDCIIYNHLRKKNIVIPPLVVSDKMAPYEGAFVKDPLVGRHKWVVNGDFDSLYPHLQMQYNLSPDTVVDASEWDDWMTNLSKQMQSYDVSTVIEKIINKEFDFSGLKERHITVTPNGQFFRTDILGFMPEILTYMYESRKSFKGQMIDAKKKKEKENLAKDVIEQIEKDIAKFDNIQNGLKVGLNSCYGAAGSKYFRFYDLRIAEAVTFGGQLSIRWVQERVNAYMNRILKTENKDYIIAVDTDSIYINMEDIVKSVNLTETKKIVDFLDKVWKTKIQETINKATIELAEYVNAHSNKMNMKREKICDKVIWVAKKRYILQVWDSEGVRYKEPTIDVTGLEMVKSSTPEACRDYLEKSLPIILNQTELEIRDFVEKFRQEYETLPTEDISFPRGVNDLKKNANFKTIYGKSTPIHVRGSLVYNHHILEQKLTSKYPLIKEGDKIRYVYLKEPNPIKENMIAFSLRFPTELGLKEYIDYELQFEKSFKEPLKIILNAIGWELEQISNLGTFYS